MNGAAAKCFSCQFLCAFTCCGTAAILAIVQYCKLAFSNDMARVDSWLSTSWSETECKVVSTGVAYRGRCQRLLTDATYDCTEEGGVRQAASVWNPGERSTSTTCIDHGDRVWELAHEGSRRLDDAPERRLKSSCKNRWVPWVLVELPSGDKRCAFRFGAEVPSIESEKEGADAFRQKFVAGSDSKCYMYPGQDCIVGLQYPMDDLENWMNGSQMYTLAAYLAAVGTAACGIALLVGCFCGVSEDDDDKRNIPAKPETPNPKPIIMGYSV